MYGQRRDNDYYKHKVNELRIIVENQRALIYKLEKENARLDLVLYQQKKEIEHLGNLSVTYQ